MLVSDIHTLSNYIKPSRSNFYLIQISFTIKWIKFGYVNFINSFCNVVNLMKSGNHCAPWMAPTEIGKSLFDFCLVFRKFLKFSSLKVYYLHRISKVRLHIGIKYGIFLTKYVCILCISKISAFWEHRKVAHFYN